MAKFSMAPIEDVVPRKKPRQPSLRVQTQHQYQEALRNAVVDRGQALIVELDDTDKALTIRNRIRRAADALELHNVSIRRRRNRIIAYIVESPEGGEQTA